MWASFRADEANVSHRTAEHHPYARRTHKVGKDVECEAGWNGCPGNHQQVRTRSATSERLDIKTAEATLFRHHNTQSLHVTDLCSKAWVLKTT